MRSVSFVALYANLLLSGPASLAHEAHTRSPHPEEMLLLGAGESGKSTILKQMKLINHGSYSTEERESYKEIIFSNTLQSMRVILDAMETLDVPLADGANAKRAEIILSLPSSLETETLPPAVADAVQGLWRDAGVQLCFKRSREFQLNDSAP